MLNELAAEINATATQKGFWEEGKDRDPAKILMLIVTELAEAFEEIRDGHPLDYEYYDHKMKPSGVPSEMADAIIRALDACHAWGIDIDRVVREKMEYNKTRPHKHGRTM